MIEFKVQRQIFSGRTVIYARQYINQEYLAVITSGVEVKKMAVGVEWPPFVGLDSIASDCAAQSLFQSLWDAGFRPNNGESSLAHVNALRAHLEDMRSLALTPKNEARVK
jgi:hypothetical protein